GPNTRRLDGGQGSGAGPPGLGTAIVPVPAIATRRLELQKPVAAGLAAVGAFLFFGALTIIAAAVREAPLAPGVEPDRGRVWRSRVASGVGGGMLLGVVLGGWTGWKAVDSGFAGQFFQPRGSPAAVGMEGGRVL